MSAVGIEIDQLVVAFEAGQRVLDQLSLDIAAGELIALLGPSGCGKSTLLRSLAGLQASKSGSIRFQTGADSVEASKHGLNPSDLSFVFQDATLLPWRTALENVCLPCELGIRGPTQQLASTSTQSKGREATERAAEAMDTKFIRERAREILDIVGLSQADVDKWPNQLSGGMRMRVSIARALITDPRVLLLDEPFAALDDILRSRLNDLILSVWEMKKHTVVFVTHNVAEAIYLSHRIAILSHGRIVRIIDNPLGWPRKPELRLSHEFAVLQKEVSDSLWEAAQ